MQLCGASLRQSEPAGQVCMSPQAENQGLSTLAVQNRWGIFGLHSQHVGELYQMDRQPEDEAP